MERYMLKHITCCILIARNKYTKELLKSAERYINEAKLKKVFSRTENKFSVRIPYSSFKAFKKR